MKVKFQKNVSQEKIETNPIENNNMGMAEREQANINMEELNRLKEENEIFKGKLENTKSNIINNIQKSLINLILNIIFIKFISFSCFM